ncbi:hypothetical protein [Streptomyces sp. NPDC001165]|uniref:hypothetical protein n=1 Tax=Streptomyces sp. NPDC001165 TaxID=3364546 RepID=UPI0036811AEE
MSGTGSAVDAFGAYTEEAAYYDLPCDDLDSILSTFARGLLGAAGRMLAVLGYRDARAVGDDPVDRAAPGVRETVLFRLPESCDMRDMAFRAGIARGFHDLADDLACGRAPVPRCAAEQWALEQMLTLASRVCAATDDELASLGVALPQGGHNDPYRPPYWEEAWQFLVEGAKYSIPEARAGVPDADGEDEALEDEVAEPAGGWDGPDYWFSPYGFLTPRDPDRGHPAWAQAHLEGAALIPDGPLGAARIAEILRLGSKNTAWAAYDGSAGYEDLAEVLTPLGAQLLMAAASNVAERGYHDLLHYGDRVFERPADEDEWYDDDSFLMELPALCDGQNAAWRLAMVRAVDDLADDLRAGRAPLPRCTAEELAFHLVRRKAEVLLDYLQDEDFARDYGLPTADAFTARHRPFDLFREVFLQDEDVLFHYDDDLAHIAADPDHPASRQLGTGDLRPNAWFVTFGNLRPRDPARGYNPHILTHLATADPEAFFASTPALTATAAEPAAEHPDPRDEFETFIGYAQRRFFDEATGIAMTVSAERLLTLLTEQPAEAVRTVWPRHDRAEASGAGRLLFDRDLCLEGLHHVWRLRADQGERHARTWALKLLDDCAARILQELARPVPAYLAHREERPALDPEVAGRLAARLNALARPDTARGTLRHQLTAHRMTASDLAAGAILPETLVTGWLDGTSAVSPAHLVRCAPVLQMPEDALLACLGGGRKRAYWPLPVPAQAHLAADTPDPDAA